MCVVLGDGVESGDLMNAPRRINVSYIVTRRLAHFGTVPA